MNIVLLCFSCFERFFKVVNFKEGKLAMRRRSGYMMEDLELIGLEYLWRVSHWLTRRITTQEIWPKSILAYWLVGNLKEI